MKNLFGYGTVTHDLSLEKLKDFFAEQLNVDKSRIIINANFVEKGDQRDSYQEFTGLKVTVVGA